MIYEVFALKYAAHTREKQENFLFRNLTDPHESASLDYFVWLITGGGRTILVDTGFSCDAARNRDRTLTVHPVDALAEMGVNAGSIEDVVITHLHYDHAGNLDAFPNARFYLQETEMAYATGPCMCHARLRHPFRLEDVQAMVALIYAGRVNFLAGDAEIYPGISVHAVPGHTRGLQCVRVETERGPLLLASDACHLYENMEQKNPFPILVDLDATYRGWDRLSELAGDRRRIIPGHDPEVMRLYPKPNGFPHVALLHCPPAAL